MCASQDYSINESADFWRYDIGVNVIPADTRRKLTNIEWSEWQDKPIPEEQHNQWKSQDLFSKGMAVIPGKVWHNEEKRDLYFTFIDADKQLAIHELCTRDGKTTSLQEFAEKFLIEQHKDNLYRAHIYFYSPIPFPKKSSDAVIGLEIKGIGEHGIANCSPSIHKDGQPYEIIGTTNPISLTSDQATELIQHIDNICKKYGLEYLDKHYKNLLDSNSKIYEGVRHASMISIANSLLFRYCGNGDKKSEDHLKQEFISINNTRCEPPLPSAEIDRVWKDAIIYFHKNNHNLNNNNNNRTTTDDEDQEELELATHTKLSGEDIAFVINTMKKEAPYDLISIKQLFFGMISAFSKNPIPHNVNSKDSGAGKSYLLNLVSSYFPQKYVIALTGMSDKAIMHRNGVMVIEKKNSGADGGDDSSTEGSKEGEGDGDEVEVVEPIAPILADLELQIEELKDEIEHEKSKNSDKDKDLIKKNNASIKEIEIEIKDILNRAEKLIDLNNQIILVWDTPQASLFDSLMSLMSQDSTKDQKYSFVEKSGSGSIRTRVNRLRGMPVLFTAQVIDDTRNSRFEEKNRRFINVTPDTSIQKISTANSMIGLRYCSLPEEYDSQVVSRQDKGRAKHIVKILIAKLKQHSKHLQPKESGIKVPFVNAITRSIPSDQVWSMTVTERLMKYLSIIAKVNMDSRPRFVNQKTGQFYLIATFEDLKEALLLMDRAASGIRPYVTRWFNDVFIPRFNALGGEPNKDVGYNGNEIASEKYVGLTTEQLAAQTKEVYGGPKPSSGDLLAKYLYPLINQGIIDKAQSKINGRQNIYFPVQGQENKLFSIFDSDNFRLKVSNSAIFPSRKVIEESIRFLSNYCYKQEGGTEKIFCDYILVDGDEKTEITVDELLDRYFFNHKNILAEDCFVKGYVEEATEEEVKAESTRKNIYYQQQILKNHHNNIFPFFTTPPCNNNFTKFPNNQIEEGNGKAVIQKPTTTSSSVVSVEEFFNKPYQPLPPHSLEQSPCYPILVVKEDWKEYQKDNNTIIKYKQQYYLCKLHNQEKGYRYNTTDLNTIEYHCKTKDPELHKAEILRLSKKEAAVDNDNDNNKRQSE